MESSASSEPTEWQAGRELDRLIATRFGLPEYGTGQEFGTGGGLPVRYSRDTVSAMELLQKADVWSLHCDRAYREPFTAKVRIDGKAGEGRGAQAAIAICRAVLQATASTPHDGNGQH